MKAKDVIIYSDIDGTYLKSWTDNPYIEAPENNIIAINRFISEGGYFGGASGREYTGIIKCFRGIDLNMPIVQNNGGAIFDYHLNKVVQSNPLSDEAKREIIDYTISHHNTWVCASDLEGIYDILVNDDRDAGAFDCYRPKMTIEECMTRDIYKMAFVIRKENMEALKEDVSKFKCFKDICAAQSSAIYYEIVKAGIDKGKAILDACKYMNFENKTLICVGDYYNDVSMLKVADIAICPSNAPDDVKKMCDYVVCSNDEGALADIINNLLEKI